MVSCRVQWLLAVVCGLSAGLAGCGSEEAAAPPPTVTAPSAPPPSSTPINIRPRNTSGNQTANRKPTGDKDEPEPPKFPGVPPEQIFTVGSDIPNFEIIPAEEVNPADVFAIAAPGVGLDSTYVTLESTRATSVQPRTGSVKLPEGFTAVASAGYSESGYPNRIRCSKDDSEMVLIPGGLFLQGEDNADPNAAPMHPVQLDPYYIDIYEITLAQYGRFQLDRKPSPGKPSNAGAADTQPAVGLTWRDSMFYCEWAGKALPTEAEWELAARGPNSFIFPWGNDRVVWQRSRTQDQIDPVGSFRVDYSPFGVFDMAGNAREWCADFYTEDAYRQAAPRDGTAAVNPQGPRRGEPSGHRVIRGNAPGWQLWYRSSGPMSEPGAGVGFRGVLRLSAAAAATETTEGSTPPPTVAPNTSQPRNVPD
jgi:formylglycine-generating enzyme required for sulfatase activity